MNIPDKYYKSIKSLYEKYVEKYVDKLVEFYNRLPKKVVLVCAAVILFIGTSVIWTGYKTFFKGNVKAGVGYLYIPTGATYEQLLDSVKVLDRIVSMRSFRRAARFEGLEEHIKPGRYKIEKGMSNRYIIRAIKFGWQTPTKITLSGNIRTKEKLAAIISKKIESDSLEVLDVLTDSLLVDSLGFNSYSFMAMFLPNTYEVYWTVTPKELVLKLKEEYDKFWNEERLGKAKSIGLTPVEVVTLASIVSEESNLKAEQPRIAGVYINRLHNNILLQADPTVKFALNDPSIKRILLKHLQINSPYNTYKHPGLPPGPIVIPGLSTIDAVLNYEKHNYRYFCAKPNLDGSHSFAVTLEEHNKNARAYQSAISKHR